MSVLPIPAGPSPPLPVPPAPSSKLPLRVWLQILITPLGTIFCCCFGPRLRRISCSFFFTLKSGNISLYYYLEKSSFLSTIFILFFVLDRLKKFQKNNLFLGRELLSRGFFVIARWSINTSEFIMTNTFFIFTSGVWHFREMLCPRFE